MAIDATIGLIDPKGFVLTSFHFVLGGGGGGLKTGQLSGEFRVGMECDHCSKPGFISPRHSPP